jgi:hypothetical protein
VKLDITCKAGEADIKAPAMQQHCRNFRAGLVAK